MHVPVGGVQVRAAAAARPEGTTEAGESVNLMDSFMPAFAVMFAFLLVGHVGQTFHKERDEGMFRRLLASPLSRASMIAGPMVAYTNGQVGVRLLGRSRQVRPPTAPDRASTPGCFPGWRSSEPALRS